MSITQQTSVVVSALPPARGPLSEMLLDRLVHPVHELGRPPAAEDDPLFGEDAALALYLLYELHYQGLAGVDDRWEWEPSVLAVRRGLEDAFEERLFDLVGPMPAALDADATTAALLDLAAGPAGPSLSSYAEVDADIEQVRELAVHRSAYQLKEADPHTWAIPRLTGRAKAAMVAIQKDEYGDGDPAAVHATLFGQTMAALGLDPSYGRYLAHIPGFTLTTCNLISLFGLHRRWRGALVGHLALFEMCSVGPMARYARGLRRLGFGPDASRFYDEHVVADEVHQVVALEDMVRSFVEDEPMLADDVVYGAAALTAVERLFSQRVLDAWAGGCSSLRLPL